MFSNFYWAYTHFHNQNSFMIFGISAELYLLLHCNIDIVHCSGQAV